MTARHDRIGPLPVATLGVAALALGPFASAQTAAQSRGETGTEEIIVTASRQVDAALTAHRVVNEIELMPIGSDSD